MPSRLSILLLALLTLPASARGGTETQPADRDAARVVAVWAGAPRFDELTTRVVEEIRGLLGPETESWQVKSLPPPPGSDLGERLSAAAAAGAAIAVIVGSAPGYQESESASMPVLRVDPLGIHPIPEKPGKDERWVGAEPMESVAGHDFQALAHLLRQISDRASSPEPEVLVLIDDWLESAEPSLRRAGERAGLSLRLEPIGPGALEAATDWERWLDARAGAAAAVYLPPGLAIDIPTLAPALAALQLPGFSGRGRADVENGVLAARADHPPQRLARRVGLEVLAWVRGLPSVAAPEAFHSSPLASDPRLVLHLGTAERLGLQLPWRIRLPAETVGSPSVDPEVTSMAGARREAVAVNLDLRARGLATAAGEQEIEQALARLRPRLRLGAGGRWSDSESAEAAFGARPERLVTATGAASWLLFSEDARAAIDIARRTQAARELELRELELDLGLEAATTLLAVARAHAFESIERQQLRSTLADLDAARARRQVGAGGRADVARLEARAARDRGSLVRARGDRRSHEVRFNRLLARPLEQPVTPRIEGFPTPDSHGAHEMPVSLPLEEIVSRPAAFAALGQELLARARERAPEIAAADEIVSAREREVLAARRAFTLPSVEATGQLSTWLADGGAGTRPPPFPGDASGFPEAPDTSWTLGLDLSWPVLTGGSRHARRARAELDLEAARALRARAEQRVEERVRLTLTALESAYEEATQARVAAEAAREAFTVIAEGYRQGGESLTTLLDAQTELLEARLRRAASAYDALTRWLQAQRASGEFLDPAAEAALTTRVTSPPAPRGTVAPPSPDSRFRSTPGGEAGPRQEKP